MNDNYDNDSPRHSVPVEEDNPPLLYNMGEETTDMQR
jgi:hypothetical protein